MSFHTRKVTIKALNDSKEIALLVYFTTAAILVLSVISFALRELHIVYRVVFGGALFVFATICLTVIFIPRVRNLNAWSLYQFVRCFSLSVEILVRSTSASKTPHTSNE